MTLNEFLLARIAEDEADARAASPHEAGGDCWCRHVPVGVLVVSPGFMLAESAAKRLIVEAHPEGRMTDTGKPECDGCVDWWPCVTLRSLAFVYDAHPDYDEEWRQ